MNATGARSTATPATQTDSVAIAGILLFATLKLALHVFANTGYGFHRDELATLDDARHLAWGFVAYPPLTPFIGRVALTLFGVSLTGFRFFAALAQSVAIVLTALMTRRLGGGRAAQWIAAVAVAIAPVSLAASSLFQYVSFDYLWWVLAAWLVVRLVDSGDARLWVAIGAVIGLGVLTKYSMAFFAAGLVAGVLTSPLRSHLRNRWLWIGAALSLLVAAPNLLWLARHDLITLEFLKSIHARDIRIGRTDGFLLQQFWVPANLLTAPIWITGLAGLFAAPTLRRFRIVGVMAVVPFLLFLVARGRSYYTAPLFPMLFAAGAVLLTRWIARHGAWFRRTAFATVVLLLAVGSGVAALLLPIAPVGSRWWRGQLRRVGDLREEFGWPGLVAEVARVWETIPERNRVRAAILCANYGEAGAVGLFGPQQGLPPAISGVNSFFLRGYGPRPPLIVVAVGFEKQRLERQFVSVVPAGEIPNPWKIDNEESERPTIYLCRGLRAPWEPFWQSLRTFG